MVTQTVGKLLTTCNVLFKQTVLRLFGVYNNFKVKYIHFKQPGCFTIQYPAALAPVIKVVLILHRQR